MVNWEYHSEFTGGYKYLFQSSFLTILISVFLKLTVQGTYYSGCQLFTEKQAAVASYGLHGAHGSSTISVRKRLGISDLEEEDLIMF